MTLHLWRFLTILLDYIMLKQSASSVSGSKAVSSVRTKTTLPGCMQTSETETAHPHYRPASCSGRRAMAKLAEQANTLQTDIKTDRQEKAFENDHPSMLNFWWRSQNQQRITVQDLLLSNWWKSYWGKVLPRLIYHSTISMQLLCRQYLSFSTWRVECPICLFITKMGEGGRQSAVG